MAKLLIIGSILLILLYLIVSSVSKLKFANHSVDNTKRRIIDISLPSFMLQRLLKKVLMTVGTGFILLIIILIIASKFKIALILLPLSFYLIGQFFVFNNHVKSLKNQKITFDSNTSQLTIHNDKSKPTTIDLNLSDFSLVEIKSVQKNNSLFLGYFELSYKNEKFYITYLLAENLQNEVLFQKLNQISRNTVTKLFPII